MLLQEDPESLISKVAILPRVYPPLAYLRRNIKKIRVPIAVFSELPMKKKSNSSGTPFSISSRKGSSFRCFINRSEEDEISFIV